MRRGGTVCGADSVLGERNVVLFCKKSWKWMAFLHVCVRTVFFNILCALRIVLSRLFVVEYIGWSICRTGTRTLSI